ncbi:MAG TPA: diacylglycerol kinase [Opitutaceae bacterium]|nr:diacylglycerol kinase [Opitutaceae bacterium]
MKPRVSTASGFLKSLRPAANGLWVMLTTQPNAQVHLVAALVVCGLGVFFEITRLEWCVLVLTIAAVWIAEALNTTIAGLCVAVIMVIAHSYFIRRLERIAARLEVIAGHLLHEYFKSGGAALHAAIPGTAIIEPGLPSVIPPRPADDPAREAGKSDFLS